MQLLTRSSWQSLLAAVRAYQKPQPPVVLFPAATGTLKFLEEFQESSHHPRRCRPGNGCMCWLLLSTRQAVSCKNSRHLDSMSHLITSQSSLKRKKWGSPVSNYLDLGKIRYPSEVPVSCWVTRPTFLPTACKGGKHMNLIHFINSNPTTSLLFFPLPSPPFHLKSV